MDESLIDFNVLNDISNQKEDMCRSTHSRSDCSDSSLEDRNSGLFAGAIFKNCTIYTGDVYQGTNPVPTRFRLLSEGDEMRLSSSSIYIFHGNNCYMENKLPKFINK